MTLSVKKRGGQKKHWADRARLEIWYKALVKRTGLSDYQLNNKFSWRPGNMPIGADEKITIFEKIRKSHQEPQGRDPRWRSMQQILIAVDSYLNNGGIKEIYLSNFWELVKKSSISLLEIRSLLDDLLKRNSLSRLDPKLDSQLSNILLSLSYQIVYQEQIELIFLKMSDLDILELLWLLYLESKAVSSSNILILEQKLDKKLEDYFNDRLGSYDKFDYYQLAINEVRKVNILIDDKTLKRIEFYQKEAMWIFK